MAAGRSWCAYAWPLAGETGRRAFFLDANGDVWGTMNRDLRYCGREQPVPVDAALPSSDAGALAEPGARVGRDGGRWFIVG